MNTLETHVLELIGEDVDSPDVFTDDSAGMAQVRDSLNDAIEEIVMLTGGTKGKYYVVLRENKSFYRLTFAGGSLAWITDAWLVNQQRRLEQTDLVRLNAFNHRWMQNTGNPESYIPVGKNILGFWPAPSADGDVVELQCVIVPERYERDTDRIKLKDSFHWAAVHYAVGEYYASRGDAKTATYNHNVYLDKLGIQTMYPIAPEYPYQYRTRKEPWPKSTQ